MGRLRCLLVLALTFALLPQATPRPATRATARPIVVVAANQSSNWSGYMQGRLERGISFHAIAADWIVPKVKQRNAGEAETSLSWIGIGGGCLDTGCTIGDDTLIQAGIGHGVNAAGDPDYYAWWEIIPLPLQRTDPPLPVRPGDRVHLAIVESATTPELWTITIANLTIGQTFTRTLMYPSSFATAEWVIERPVTISEDGRVQVSPMPDLAVVHFDAASANGTPANFVASERIEMVDIELVDFTVSRVAMPSLPDREADGFNDCTYRKTCRVPGNDVK